MFAFHHLPESGGRGPARTDHHFRFEKAEPLEVRRSQSTVAIAEAVGLAPSADLPGFRSVFVSGTDNTLFFDGTCSRDFPASLAS